MKINLSTLQDKIVANVDVDPDTGCWLWRRYRNHKGYGRMSGRLAHREAYRAWKGDPDGQICRHRCDVRACCNPDHLDLGTHQDNVDDRVTRGRSAIGEESGKAKLTEDQVLEIRSLYATGRYTQKQLAERFGVDHSNVSLILLRKR